jgi:hypothetical protein
MPKRPEYTKADLKIGSGARVQRDQKTVVHTHEIRFGRPLTAAERNLFSSVLLGFYHTVHFSQQFGDGLVSEPVVEFITPDRVRYTLRQTSLSGPWKELLFTILANFSHEIVPILSHDDSHVFAPQQTKAVSTP